MHESEANERASRAVMVASHRRISRVFINGRFLTQRPTGIQRYAAEVLHALDALITRTRRYSGPTYCILAPEGTSFPRLINIETQHVGPFQGHLWEQTTLPWAARDGLLWSFGPMGPLLTRNQAVTIHDATVHAVPEAFSWKFRTLYRLALPVLTRRTAQVMTVSEFSRGEVARHFGADAGQVRVSGEGWQHARRIEADNSILAKRSLVPKRYVLAVSSVTPHKNFAVIQRALARLSMKDYRIVIAGEVNPRVFGSMSAASLRSIEQVGFVSDAELRALYENAALFIYPSLYEGFGLPPLEAMAFDCPVIASHAAAIPEVCGDAALYFNPYSDEELAHLIQRLVDHPHERDALVLKGRAQLARHSWDAAARTHLGAIEHVMDALNQTRWVRNDDVSVDMA